MASTAARIAIERKSTDPISRKLHELTRAGVNWPRIYSQMQELETVGDILRENTQPHLLALLYFDLRRAPATPFKDPGHKQNLSGSGMWRSLKKVRVQHRRRQYHDDPTRARANASKKRGGASVVNFVSAFDQNVENSPPAPSPCGRGFSGLTRICRDVRRDTLL